MKMGDLFLLIKEEIDFHTIYGIYNDYIKALEDYNNLLKYNYIYKDDLHIYKFTANKFYNDEEYVKCDG